MLACELPVDLESPLTAQSLLDRELLISQHVSQ